MIMKCPCALHTSSPIQAISHLLTAEDIFFPCFIFLHVLLLHMCPSCLETALLCPQNGGVQCCRVRRTRVACTCCLRGDGGPRGQRPQASEAISSRQNLPMSPHRWTWPPRCLGLSSWLSSRFPGCRATAKTPAIWALRT